MVWFGASSAGVPFRASMLIPKARTIKTVGCSYPKPPSSVAYSVLHAAPDSHDYQHVVLEAIGKLTSRRGQ